MVRSYEKERKMMSLVSAANLTRDTGPGIETRQFELAHCPVLCTAGESKEEDDVLFPQFPKIYEMLWEGEDHA